LTGQSPQDEGESQPKVCNVCHLPYEGEECPWCKAEREHASAVIEERGRRHTADKDGYRPGED
jgi:hypothetical protein